MRRSFSVGLLCSLLVWPAAAEAARPLRTAIVDPRQLADPTTADSAFARVAGTGGIRGTGAKFVKIYVNWRAVARTQPTEATNPENDAYRWSRLDEQVTRADAHGLTPIIYMANAPDWAEGYEGTFEGSGRPSPAKLADFMTALATRYDGDFPDSVDPLPAVRYWMVWCECALVSGASSSGDHLK